MNKTLLKKQGGTHEMIFNRPQHMDMPVLTDQQELIYISSVQTQDIVWKTCQEQWMKEIDGEKEPRKSMFVAWTGDDDLTKTSFRKKPKTNK